MKNWLCAIAAGLGLLMVVGCDMEFGDYSAVEDPPTQEEIATAQETEAAANNETPGADANAPLPRGASEQFLWKPISEHGPLVILLPASLRGRVTGCTLSSASAGTVAGRFAGDTHNGYRPHYRFNRRGGDYGNNITVTATLSDGSTRSWFIPNGAQRTTH